MTASLRTDRPAAALAAHLAAHGRLRELAGNTPVLLTDPARVHLLTRGTIELFLVSLKAGEPSGARHHFATVEAGGLLFGLDSDDDLAGCAILAVAHVGSQVIEAPAESLRALGPGAPAHGDLAHGLESWVRALSRGLSHWVTPRPVVSIALQPGEAITPPAGRRCTSRAGIAWVSLQPAAALYLDTQEVPSGSGDETLLPVAPESWLLMVDPVPLAARTTTEVLADGSAWAGLGSLHQLLFDTAEMNLRLADVDEFNRLRARVTSVEQKRQRGFADLMSVVDVRMGDLAPPERDHDPLVAALRVLGAHEGFELRLPWRKQGEATSFQLPELAAASGFRTRNVVLRSDWMESDFGALLASDRETGKPLALLSNRSGGPPRIFDPMKGGDIPLAETVERLSPQAVALTTPLPLRPLTLLDLPRFAFPRGWRDTAAALAAGAIGGLLGMAVPIATGYLIDTVIPGHDRAQLVEMGLILMVIGLTSFVMRYVGTLAYIRAESLVGPALQSALMDRLLRLPVTFFRDYSTGDLAARVGAIAQIQQKISGSTAAAIMGGLFSVFSFALMFHYDTRLALWACVLTAVYTLLTGALGFLRLRHEKTLIAADGTLQSLLLQIIVGIAKIRLSASEDRAFARWAHAFAGVRRMQLSAALIGTLQGTLNSIFSFAGLFVFILVMTRQGDGMSMMAVGAFSAFLGAFQNFNSSITQLTQVLMDLTGIKPLLDRAAPILAAAPEIGRGREDPGVLSGGIEVSQVSFRYAEGGPPILDGVSVSAAPGEFVAIVGASGSGKSTLLRLLLGFETAGTGGILFDGQDLRNLDATAVRRQMGVVLQSSQPMPGSLYENIVGAAGGSVEDAWEAAAMVGLDEDIRQMPMGMHTMVLEGGGSLSGGQAQRLMIARAIVGRPKMLLLDEATSALDNRSQAVVTESLDRLSVTRIVVAHRLSTIISADRIYVMAAGRVVEVGSYAELMAANGAFARLAERQMV